MATGLVDMLRDVPGVYIQKKWGGDTRLSIRGSGIGNANHLRGTLVAQDGMPLNEADGYGDTQLVDPFLARYTEVYKGGNALRYGGALLGGAINIITPNGKTMPETGVLRVEGGDYGTARAHASVGGQWGNWDAFGAVSGYKTNGWRQQSEGEWQFASANTGYTFGDDQEVRAYVSGGYIHQQIPGALSLDAGAEFAGAGEPRQYRQRHYGRQLPARPERATRSPADALAARRQHRARGRGLCHAQGARSPDLPGDQPGDRTTGASSAGSTGRARFSA